MTALISPCTEYRYWLRRPCESLFSDRGPAFFVMLNPSVADAEVDDATIKRCRGFARDWGCDGLLVANLYAYRSTDSGILWLVKDPVGPDNDFWLEKLLEENPSVICAWGAEADVERVKSFLEIASRKMAKLWCLGTTKNGSPRHPLYVKGNQQTIPWLPSRTS